MQFAFWAVLIAAVLPLLFAALSKSGGMDNHAPRAAQAALHGWRQRAHWAQLGSVSGICRGGDGGISQSCSCWPYGCSGGSLRAGAAGVWCVLRDGLADGAFFGVDRGLRCGDLPVSGCRAPVLIGWGRAGKQNGG